MKIRHILKKEEFTDILTSGKKTRGSKMVVYTGNAPDKEIAIGLIIPKKMVPMAVTRNYIRRRIYAFFTSLPEKRTEKKRRIIQVIRPIKKIKRKHLSEIVEEELKVLFGKE